MALFRKNVDPLAQRAQSLNRRIAELEAEITRLNRTLGPDPQSSSTGHAAFRATELAEQHRPEPVFEKMPPRPFEPRVSESPGREALEMDLKRPVWSQWWRRLKRQFVVPPPSNEKLVNYLAAGSIQGLRTLRYERRIARNRIIFICVVVGLILWGALIVFWQAH
jgi:hypothetical protein